MMTTLDVVSTKKPEPSAEELAARELVRLAREQGLSLTGPDGLLKQFTKSVLETALNEEMTEHLGHEKNRAPGERDSSNVRNGTRPKTVLTEATGRVEIDVPRDRDGTFDPVIVRKRQRRLSGVDEIVLSLYAHGLTTGRSAPTSPRSTAPLSRRRRSLGSPTRWSRRWRPGRPDPWSRCTRPSSSTRPW